MGNQMYVDFGVLVYILGENFLHPLGSLKRWGKFVKEMGIMCKGRPWGVIGFVELGFLKNEEVLKGFFWA